MSKYINAVICLLAVILCFTGCSMNNDRADESINNSQLESVTEGLEADDDGVPRINVYVVEDEKTEQMDIETYLMGVVAGEMRNDWPIEALKAQAILARTYTLKFLNTKESKYGDADISTDITEAQAYNAAGINDRVRSAVEETRGIVMTYEGELPQAWFHSHSGGMTELASLAIDYKSDPEYLVPVASLDSEKAPDDVKNWKAVFSVDEVIKAARDSGMEIDRFETVELGVRGRSGRTSSIVINGNEVSAPTFRINIGPDKLKSTLIDEVYAENGNVVFVGRGYGHGVGMSQWGAYALAEKGATAQTIVSRYFDGVTFVDLWE